MDMIPRNDYGERCQFDAYCKLVLYHEAIDYLREMQRRRDRELSFSDLPQMEMDKLCVADHYPSDRFTFSSHGYDLHIDNTEIIVALDNAGHYVSPSTLRLDFRTSSKTSFRTRFARPTSIVGIPSSRIHVTSVVRLTP